MPRKLFKSQWLRPVGLVALAVLLGLGAGACNPPVPPEIAEGTDCWATDPEGTAWTNQKAIPAGFFNPADEPPASPKSAAFPKGAMTVELQGKPLEPAEVTACGCPQQVTTTVTWLDPHGNPTNDIRHKVGEVVEITTDVDTCVHRAKSEKFKGQGSSVKVDIELRQLSLESKSPVTVTYHDNSTKDFNVLVTEKGTQNKGTMTFTANNIQNGKADGGISLDKLPIHFQITFTDVNDPNNQYVFEDSADLSGTTGRFKQGP